MEGGVVSTSARLVTNSVKIMLMPTGLLKILECAIGYSCDSLTTTKYHNKDSNFRAALEIDEQSARVQGRWIRSDSSWGSKKSEVLQKLSEGVISNPEKQNGKKEPGESERQKNNSENQNGKRVRQGSLPHVPNALTLEAYISLVAHMYRSGCSLLFVAAYLYRPKCGIEPSLLESHDLLLPLRHRLVSER